MKPTNTPQKPEREPTNARFDRKGEYATPMTEPSAKDRIEQLIESIRGRRATNTIPIGIGARNPLTEHSIKDRIEQLLGSIRKSRTSDATVPICIGARMPGTSMVHDARRMLSKDYFWSFTASGKTFGKKKKATHRAKTPKDSLKLYPWSVGPAIVEDYAAVPDGLETFNEATILTHNGDYWGFSESGSSTDPWKRRTDISRNPTIFPGFDIGCVTQQRTYYPLLPVPLTSCIDEIPEEN